LVDFFDLIEDTMVSKLTVKLEPVQVEVFGLLISYLILKDFDSKDFLLNFLDIKNLFNINFY